MEQFNGDRQNPNVTDLAHRISHFPATDCLLSPTPVSVVHSTEIDRQNLPPQKLRPIRPSGRCSPTSSHGNDLPPPPESVFDKFGLLVDQVCSMNSEYFAPPEKAAAGEFDFGDDGLQCLVADCSNRIGSGMSGQDGFPDSDDESSSSSGEDDLSGVKENASRERKRKRRKKLEDFLQSLVTKVMDKQEQMHKQLIETMERRERERIIREEAWKQQEKERTRREKEIRAQENARSLALISFIETMMGHKVETPQSLMMMIPSVRNDEENNSNISIQKDFHSDPNNRRWPEVEIQALIMLRAAMEQKFRAMGGKCNAVWDEISTGMSNMGYNRTAKKCKEKWENMNKYFRRSFESGVKKRYGNSKTCSYFQELHILYKNGFVNPGNAFNHADIENETKNSNT